MMKADKFIQECREQRIVIRADIRKAKENLSLMEDIQTKIENLTEVLEYLNGIINSVEEPKNESRKS